MLDKREMLNSWVLVLIWMAVIFTLSSIPGDRLPKILSFDISLLAHALEYGLLGALIMNALRNSNLRLSLPGLVMLAVTLTALFAISDEIHQYFVPNRLTDMGDFLADILSSFAGAIFYTAKITSFKNPHQI